MSERASVFETTQIGVETVPGTPVAAGKKLLATSIEPSVQAEMVSVRPLGGKFATAAFMGKEWAKAAIQGQASYNDLTYLLAGLLANQAPVQQGLTAAYKWTFSPAQSAPDTIATFTVESGSSVRAGRFAYGLVRELAIKSDRGAVEVSGEMIGGLYADGITLTATPTEIEVVPVMPNQMSVYMDPSAATLGTTKLTRVLRTEISIGNRFEPLWTLDAAETSFVAHVESAPATTMKLLVEADAAGMALLATMRTGAKKFVRFAAVGEEIASPYNYLLQLDMCGTVTDVSEFSDQDGVFAIEWTLQATYDATWTKALEAVLINTLLAL